MTGPEQKVVAVAFPMALSGVYDYRISPQFDGRVFPGVPVLVELRSRRLWGVAVRLKASSDHPDLKPLLDIKSDRWTDADSSLIRLYEWMATYYQCDLGRVFRPFIRKSVINAAAKRVTVFRIAQEERPVGLLTEKQAAALDLLKSFSGELSADVCGALPGVTPHLLVALCAKGALVRDRAIVVRKSEELRVAEEGAAYGGEVVLTREQTAAVAEIGIGLSQPSNPFLLHGITGSGKTHVYIELVKRVLLEGKGAIVLVPEISLTPQTIARFRRAVGDCIAVIHSRMSEGERHDSLAELVNGNKRVVIGVRSAVLVPVVRLGLIIVDEEHDGSYKQSDTDPRYNARDVAVMRAHLQRAAVVLGSATPSLESRYNAECGKYRLVTLLHRFGEAVLPQVSVVDMRKEHEENNWTFLSRYLRERITAALTNGRQTILLLNRRGFSTFLLCKDCGHAYQCPSCSVNLIYHKSELRLKCHQCGHDEPAPRICPKCRGEQIEFKGTGIQKAEEMLRADFPSARIIRMDQDTTRGKSGHIDIIARFERREADILLGTQMVSKGLDFPGVALVGVLAADIGLHFPDFRAAERTFQLLSQVAGRAGRTDRDGEVVIQTYFPDEPAIRAAQGHDYGEFYNKEIAERQALAYPPFGKLVRLVLLGENEARVSSLLSDIKAGISRHVRNSAVSVLGPSPAVWSRLKNEFRYCLLLKALSPKALGEAVLRVRTTVKVPKDMRLVIDVDPVNML
jgi:primosomal protein N' (replication factor Y) (superfamily II helicase)